MCVSLFFDGVRQDVLCFFFFQAEDGIRDGHVTGVQTCALPICLILWQTPDREPLRAGWEGPVEGTGAGWVWRTQEPLIVHDADRESRFPITSDVMRGQGIKSYYVFPLTPAGRRLGVMGFGCRDAFGCSDESLEFMRQVVKQVAVAVGNALNFEGAEAARRELAAERDRLRLLLEVNNAVVTNLDLHDLFAAVSAALRAVLHHEFVSLSLYDPASEELRVHVLDFAGARGSCAKASRCASRT